MEPEREAALLREVKVPDGFQATLFAAPPAVNYPVFVAAAPDGTVYVASDRNGSIDRGPDRGRVLRVRDLDGDGRADEVKQFVPNVDSPRGLVWDHDRLYLLHPPHLSVFIDKDHDGVADEQRILVKNIAFTFKDRPADHSSNGIELGIDGWLYCAIGDFGFMEAEGTDGRKLQLRGGGVVRVRPDGAGLELYSRGTRNILEAAVSPLLDSFARDNTNDGDGWDIRLHHFTGLSEHGYPSLYKHFADEIVPPLADYGGGSGCGAMFLDEPGFPAGYGTALYTADWGREWIYRHQLTPKGASFEADQTEFIRAPRVTDLDVDASSRIYVASWKGATFTYVGENVGFLVRVTPKDYTPEPLPNFESLSAADLIRLLESPSHRRRLEAQRQLLRRGIDRRIGEQLRIFASDPAKPLASRVAALFAIKQGLGNASADVLLGLSSDDSIREYAIRALCDNLGELHNVPAAPLLSGLADSNPRVRRESAFALARLGKVSHANALSLILNDSDSRVAHTAMQALKQLKASDACFAILDHPNSPEAMRNGALLVLQSVHESKVVDGLLQRLETERDANRRRGLLTALCRLHFTDGQWKGDSWGTRPDTSGPYYQPAAWEGTPRIANALHRALTAAPREEAVFLAQELSRHKVQSADILTAAVRMANSDTELIPPVLAQLSRADRLPSDAAPLLERTAIAEETPDVTRAQAIMALARNGTAAQLEILLKAMPLLEQIKRGDREIRQARDAFLNSSAISQDPELVRNKAAELLPGVSVWADAALLKLADRRNAPAEKRKAAQDALESGWQNPKRRTQIIQAMIVAEHRGWRDRVLEAVDDTDPAVAEAAQRAVTALRLKRESVAKPAEAPTLDKMNASEIVSAIANVKGETKLGEELFTRQTCANCHTVSADQPLRGPFIGNIAAIYKRPELAEAILVPNKTLAQGFVAHRFELKDGTEIEGFVIQEAADVVTVRNVAAQEIRIPVSDIVQRSKLEKSLMPDGLAANLTLKEFASLLDYLESLVAK